MDSSLSSVSASTSIGQRNLPDLPDLVYYHLFKYLNIEEIFKLKLVSKKLYFIVNDHNIYELSFFDHNYLHRGNWVSTTRPFKLKNQLHSSKISSLLSNPPNNLLNLKYLKIKKFFPLSFNIDCINKFTKLEILELAFFMPKKYFLQLPDLKALYIEVHYLRIAGTLMVDAPNLHSFYFVPNKYDTPLDEMSDGNLIGEMIQFKHPSCIKFLKLVCFHGKDISIFRNLECLELQLVCDNFDLQKFKNLKKFKIDDLNHLNYLKNLFETKDRNLEMVINGVKIKRVDQLDKLNKHELEFQLDNYVDLEDNLSFVENIFDGHELMLLLSKIQLPNLFRKYNNIQYLTANSRVEDENGLIHLIKESPNLYGLHLEQSSLSQQFYDQLPVISSLSVLEIDERNINLSLDYLKKIPYLIRFSINLDIPIEKFDLNDFKHLDHLQFNIDDQIFSISKRYDGNYDVPYFESQGLSDKYCFELTELTNLITQLANSRKEK